MLPVIVAYDPALPFVASQAFETAGQSFKDGDPVKWRELGIDEFTLQAWWRSGLVRCEMVGESPAPPLVAPAKPQTPQRRR